MTLHSIFRTLRVFSTLLILSGPSYAGMPPIPPSAPTVQKETLGSKLRNAYQAASKSNYVVNSPWFSCISANPASVVCSAWSASTTYSQGTVVSVGTSPTHLLVLSNSSCTSGTGTPSVGTSFDAVISDGGCSWYYLGAQTATSNDAGAPTLSTASGTAPWAGAVWWVAGSYPSLYTPNGVSISTTYGTYYKHMYSFNNFLNNPVGIGGEVCANVTDVKFAIASSSGGTPYSVTIDDRLLSAQAVNYNTGNPADVIFDFSTTTGFKTRKVCVRGGKYTPNFGGIFTTSQGSVTPATPPVVNAAYIYDSYDAGSSYGPFSGYSLLSQQVGARMGWSVWSMSQGTTGPQNKNVTYYNYQQRIYDSGNMATLANMDVIVTNLSTNDSSCTGSTNGTVCPTGSEATALQNMLSGIRSVNSNALIVVFGPAPVNGGAGYSAYVAEETSYATAVTGWADPAGVGKICYIPGRSCLAKQLQRRGSRRRCGPASRERPRRWMRW